MKPKVAIVAVRKFAEKMFSDEDLDRLRNVVDLKIDFFETLDEQGLKETIKGMDGVISSWETPAFTADVLESAPDLKIISHAAGSVKPIVSDAVWERDIVVTSSAAAISIGVAETALTFILCGGKRVPWLSEAVKNGDWACDDIKSTIQEMFRSTIGIIGAGHVGRHLIRLLKSFEVDILLTDPYICEGEADALRVEKTTLDDLLKRSDFITVCAPLTDETEGMLGKEQLKLIRDGAFIINTARGAIFDEAALIEELKTGRLTACLDVTDGEPPAADNPLRTLDNVILTPHIAGVVTNNFLRLGALAVDEVVCFFNNEPNIYPIKQEMLARIG